MLPNGFEWTPRYQYAKGELALKLDGTTVAQLMQRIGGGWFARLECQRPIAARTVMRDCLSRETGITGIEAWARRHEGRLRVEAAYLPQSKYLSPRTAAPISIQTKQTETYSAQHPVQGRIDVRG